MAPTDATDDPSRMGGHALAVFIREQMGSRRWRQRDVARESHGALSRQQVSKYANDYRDHLGRLPEKATLEGFSTAFGVPMEFLLAKAVEALALGYSSGDFINDVTIASDDELLDEIRRRLREVGVSSDELIRDQPATLTDKMVDVAHQTEVEMAAESSDSEDGSALNESLPRKRKKA